MRARARVASLDPNTLGVQVDVGHDVMMGCPDTPLEVMASRRDVMLRSDS